MSGLQIEFKFPDWKGLVLSRQEEINRFIAAQVQTNRGMLFDSEGSYNGRQGWAPLKWRRGQILSDRGTLRKSIAPFSADGTAGPGGFVDFTDKTVTVGTKLLYASMMNWGTTRMPGGKLVPKRAKALKIPMPNGKKGFMFRKSVKIPARRFDDWNEQDQMELDQSLSNFLRRMIGVG